MVKNPPEMQETWVWSLGQEDSPGEVNGNHSSSLAWRIPWTEELGELQSMGLQRVGYNWVTQHACTSYIWVGSNFFPFLTWVLHHHCFLKHARQGKACALLLLTLPYRLPGLFIAYYPYTDFHAATQQGIFFKFFWCKVWSKQTEAQKALILNSRLRSGSWKLVIYIFLSLE